MARLLDRLPGSVLGLKGERPKTFGVDPIPPDSLHKTYSVNGIPDNIKWRVISGYGMKPQPSRLDLADGNDLYNDKPGRTYYR
jgi:hypothetical protein